MTNTHPFRNGLMADLHLHAVKSTDPEAQRKGIVDVSCASSEYRGISLDQFLDAKRKSKEGYYEECFLDTVSLFQDARVPPSLHLVDALVHAVMDEDFPDALTFLTIGTPNCFTTEEIIRLSEAFRGKTRRAMTAPIEGRIQVSQKQEGLLIDIIPSAPLSFEWKKLAAQLEAVALSAEAIGYRPVVKAHPLIQQFSLGQIPKDIFLLLNDFGALLVTHTGVFQGGPCKVGDGIPDIEAADPEHLRKPAERYKHIDFVLSHMGTPDRVVEQYWINKGIRVAHFRDALRLVLDFPNVYGDIGGLMYNASTQGRYGEGASKEEVDFAPRCQMAFENLIWRRDDRTNYSKEVRLADKLVFGSDFPRTSLPELKKQMRVLGRGEHAKSMRNLRNNLAHRSYKLARLKR